MKILWFLIQVINYRQEALSPWEVHYVRKVGRGHMAWGGRKCWKKQGTHMLKAQSINNNWAEFLNV